MITMKSPLEGTRIGNVDTLAICELPALHTIDLRVAPGSSLQAAVAETLGIDLPGKPGQTTINENKIYTFCLAPDWWIVVGLQDAVQKLSSELNYEHHYSVVDVSGQRTTIELEGPNVRDVLAHLWEQDLREKSFPVGSVSQGLMAKAPVIVYHIGTLRYRVMVRSSFALHLWKALEDAAEEWM